MDTETSTSQRTPSEPPTSAPRVIGTLNLVFSGLLLMCGACTGINFVMQAAMAPMVEGMQENAQAAMSAEVKKARDEKLAELKEQAQAATSDDERAEIETQIDEQELAEPVQLPKMDMMAVYREPQIVGYMWTDLVSMVVLNVLLFASGLGLLAAKAWARKLAIWTAALKIIRLIAVYGYFVAVVAPLYAQVMSKMMENMVNVPRRPGAPPMPPMGPTLGTIYGIFMSVGAILMILVGIVYPIIVLWVLSRPKVKSACGETALRPVEPT